MYLSLKQRKEGKQIPNSPHTQKKKKIEVILCKELSQNLNRQTKFNLEILEESIEVIYIKNL